MTAKRKPVIVPYPRLPGVHPLLRYFFESSLPPANTAKRPRSTQERATMVIELAAKKKRRKVKKVKRQMRAKAMRK